MDATPNIAFTPGTAVILTTIENGFPAIRHGEFLSHVDGGQQATVKFGLETFTVQLDQLSRQHPPQPPAFLGKWFEAPKPPPIPSDADIQARLTERRQQLAQAQRAGQAGAGSTLPRLGRSASARIVAWPRRAVRWRH